MPTGSCTPTGSLQLLCCRRGQSRLTTAPMRPLRATRRLQTTSMWPRCPTWGLRSPDGFQPAHRSLDEPNDDCCSLRDALTGLTGMPLLLCCALRPSSTSSRLSHLLPERSARALASCCRASRAALPVRLSPESEVLVTSRKLSARSRYRHCIASCTTATVANRRVSRTLSSR